MDNLLLLFFIAFIKVVSILILGSSVFRLPIRSYWIEYLGFALLGPFIAVILYNLGVHLLLINILFVVLVFIFYIAMLKASVWHSFIVGSAGILLGSVIEVIVTLMLSVVNPGDISKNVYLLIYESAKFIIVAGFAWFLFKSNLGFVFVSEKMNNGQGFKSLNRLIILSVVLGFAAIFAYIMSGSDSKNIYLVILLVFIITASAGTYRLVQRENQEYYKEFND